ncbi:MAG: hypothetical protein JSV52_13605 [Candidatus Zixiibacteriota bacterium]|nr:MAG: hypothetical protein JSV52_13605 [candidate division Zixibacteria bacterium]
MTECRHRWEMANIQFGFVVFERCSHCNELRTYFSLEDTWDEYREDGCQWSIVENAQTFRFDLKCRDCNRQETFEDLMGLLYCTSCQADCEVEILRKTSETEKIFVLVAFGFLPQAKTKPIPQRKLDILTDYFNQRRDTSRSKIKIVSFNMIGDYLSRCRGEFIHDVGMLSQEPEERKRLL